MATTEERMMALLAAEGPRSQVYIAQTLGVSRQRIHQITKAKGLALPSGLPEAIQRRRRTVTWQCASCGQERQLLPSRARHRRCLRCHIRWVQQQRRAG